MNIRVTVIVVVVFLTALATSEGKQQQQQRRRRSPVVEMHCRCIETESKPIGRQIREVELIPANSHCEKLEVIAKLKSGIQVCLDPQVPWVKKIIDKILSMKQL